MSIIGLLLTALVALIFLSAALAPLESLGWYAGWFGEKEEEPQLGIESAGGEIRTRNRPRLALPRLSFRHRRHCGQFHSR